MGLPASCCQPEEIAIAITSYKPTNPVDAPDSLGFRRPNALKNNTVRVQSDVRWLGTRKDVGFPIVGSRLLFRPLG
jgi:hypothetical protein